MSLEKIDRIRSHKNFTESQIDALIITKPENVIYVLGFKVESDVIILIPKRDLGNLEGKIQVFLNVLEFDQAKKNIENDKELSQIVDIQQIPAGNPKYVQKMINKLDINCLGFEDDYISVKRYNEWKEKFKIPNYFGISNIINDARLIKTQDEINRMKRAGELGNIGFQVIYESIKEGMTEKELAAEAEYAMRKAGSDGISFDTIVASGERSAYPHALTSERRIEDGDIIIVDIGAKYNGYCSDMTRTFIFGNVDPIKAKLVNLVNESQEIALNNIKAEMIGSDVDKLVRDFFIKSEKEWGSRFIHSLGHGVGIDIHENPYLSPISQVVLKENMIVTIEPGLYIPGLGGARTEDQIVIKKEGFISLTDSKKYYYK